MGASPALCVSVAHMRLNMVPQSALRVKRASLVLRLVRAGAPRVQQAAGALTKVQLQRRQPIKVVLQASIIPSLGRRAMHLVSHALPVVQTRSPASRAEMLVSGVCLEHFRL